MKTGYLLKSRQSFWLFYFLFLTASFMISPFRSYAKSYYVDNACSKNGDGDCDISSCACASGLGQHGPFNSLANMQNKLGGYLPGDNIYLKKGRIFSEKLIIPASGVQKNPITFGSYGNDGDQPILQNLGVDFNKKDYIRVTKLQVNGPIILNGNNDQVDYVVSEYSLGNTITMSGSSNFLYNNTFINKNHIPIFILGGNNTVKNNIIYTNYTKDNIFINVDPKASASVNIDNNIYYGVPKNAEFGINGLLNGLVKDDVDNGMLQMKDLGFTVSREEIVWPEIEKYRGFKDWRNTDYSINKLIDNNIEPLVVLRNSPKWANGSTDEHYVPHEKTDLLKSGDFENGYVLDWKITAGNWGSVEDEQGVVHSGSHAVKLSSGANGDEVSINQIINVTAGKNYAVQYWTQNEPELYSVYDVNHGKFIIPKTGGNVISDTYTQKIISFKVPEGCTQVEISFYPSLWRYIRLDDIHVYEMTGPTFQTWKKDFVNFAAEVAKRYKGKIKRYEVWNEPTIAFFWRPVPDINQYMELYTDISNVIHSIDPSAEVAVQIGAFERSVSDSHGGDFLQAIYDNKIYPDAVSYHVYSDLMVDSPTVVDTNNFNSIDEIRKIMVKNGQTEKKMWVTEFGWSSQDVGLENQALYSNMAFDLFKNTYSGYVSVNCLYVYRKNNDYGIYDSDGKEKPVAVMIDKFLGPKFIWNWSVYDFNDWKKITNQDKYSLSYDAMFYDENSDFQIKYNSPAINSGIDVGLKTDFAGNNIQGFPDIGAYEYVPRIKSM